MTKAELQSETRANEEILALLHDLRTPLAGAKRALELIMDGCCGELPENATNLLDCVRSSNQQLLDMVEQVMDSFQCAHPMSQSQNTIFDIGDLIREAVAEGGLAMTKPDGLDIASSVGDGARVCANPIAIKRVLSNLLSNAVKFTASTIVVASRRDKDFIVVEVTDNGAGIDDAEMSRLFTPFCQTASGRLTSGGRGYGLYLAKAIVLSFGGKISCCRNSNGVGCTFAFQLPIYCEQAK